MTIPTPAAATVIPIRQPTAFVAAPNPLTTSTSTSTSTTSGSSSSSSLSSNGPTFNYHKGNTKTPTRIPPAGGPSQSQSQSAADSEDASGGSGGSGSGGTQPSMVQFCVEGYVNTPELSAGRGGGLSQGLPATGPYRSLFRAGSNKSRSESRTSASSNHHHHSNHHDKNGGAAVLAPSSGLAASSSLHVLAEAAQSPEAQSPIISPAATAASASASSPSPPQPTLAAQTPTSVPPVPHPVPTSRKRARARKPSPLVESTSPASPVATLDGPVSARRSSPPVASTNASSSSRSHIIVDPSRTPPPRHPRAKLSGGGTSGKGKQRETHPPEELGHERGSVPPSGRQLSERPGVGLHEPPESVVVVQDRPRNVQKNGNRNGGQSLKESTPADHLGYDHAEGDYYPSYFEAGPSGASDIACEGGQSLSPSQTTVNHDPESTHIAASKESSLALKAESRSVTPGIKARMITLLIEDRRHGTDELAEVHVPLRTAGEGCLWADAKDVCVALQSGPSRIDGACMRGC